MIGVLKFLTHVVCFLTLVVYVIFVNGPDIGAVGEQNGWSFKGAMWVVGIGIVLVWGAIISALDWVKRKMSGN